MMNTNRGVGDGKYPTLGALETNADSAIREGDLLFIASTGKAYQATTDVSASVILNTSPQLYANPRSGVDGGGGGGSIAALYAVLRDPALTPEMVEEFSSTNEGYAAWGSLNSLETTILQDATVMAAVASSASAMNAIVTSSGLVAPLAGSNVAMTAIVANPTATTILVNSYVAMRVLAESSVALEALFASATARTIMWDAGKATADALLRESAHAPTWLLENVSVTKSVTTNNAVITHTTNKAYILSSTQESNSGTVAVGYFVGDHNSGTVSDTEQVTRVFAERANGVITDATGSYTHTETITFIDMG